MDLSIHTNQENNMKSEDKLTSHLEALNHRTAALVRRVRRLQIILILLAALWFVTITAAFFSTQQYGRENEVLTVRGIVVVDERGTPRVQIGAPLPDPPVLGKRISRGGTAHGLLLFDREGNERGGYVTFDESGLVMLSLDEIAHMVAQFAAGPAGGARLWMRNIKDQNLRIGVNLDGVYAEDLPVKEQATAPADKEPGR